MERFSPASFEILSLEPLSCSYSCVGMNVEFVFTSTQEKKPNRDYAISLDYLYRKQLLDAFILNPC